MCKSCVCIQSIRADPYWAKMCKIMKLQYIILAGVCLPLILIGSFSYLVPGFLYCKNYSYLDAELAPSLIEKINIVEGITTTITNAQTQQFQQFKTAFNLTGTDLSIYPASRKFPCSNAYLHLNLQPQQALSVTADEVSPVKIDFSQINMSLFELHVSHFSGEVNITKSSISKTIIVSEAKVNVTYTSSKDFQLNDSVQIRLMNSTLPNMSVFTAGNFIYTQLINEPIVNISVQINSPNVRGFTQKLCIPAASFSGKCAQIQNKYWSGDVGVNYYVNGVKTEAILKDKQIRGKHLKEFAVGEIMRVCSDYTLDTFATPVITMLNRAEATLVLYEGDLPTECE
ncbi:Conserved_hypothetical protein [Hexamita inflata]|uniref:Uncharacterized protein n=1 Tax=Hexamita inflata TaxID=28002 RepID=A0AA86Q4W1_9EUKA|nr:Conserved hypothetical protein [Hexamita inflata]